MSRGVKILIGLFFVVALATVLLAVKVIGEMVQPKETAPLPTPQVSNVTVESTRTLPTIAVPTSTQVPTATTVPTITPTPTATPLFIDYRLKSTIDLSNGMPLALIIYAQDGKVIASTWAKAIAYKGTDTEADDVFNPHKGTVYSHIDGGFRATWVHSGYLTAGELFGYAVEKYVWLNDSGNLTTFDNGVKKTASLIGSRAVLCQAVTDIPIFSKYDMGNPCPGKLLEFTITAAALIPREKTDAYEAAIGKVVPWLKENASGAKFELMSDKNGYLIQTCVARYADQKSDGIVADYLYNRLVLGLTLK